MKKKILSLLLALVMIVGLLPVTAFAGKINGDGWYCSDDAGFTWLEISTNEGITNWAAYAAEHQGIESTIQMIRFEGTVSEIPTGIFTTGDYTDNDTYWNLGGVTLSCYVERVPAGAFPQPSMQTVTIEQLTPIVIEEGAFHSGTIFMLHAGTTNFPADSARSDTYGVQFRGGSAVFEEPASFRTVVNGTAAYPLTLRLKDANGGNKAQVKVSRLLDENRNNFEYGYTGSDTNVDGCYQVWLPEGARLAEVELADGIGRKTIFPYANGEYYTVSKTNTEALFRFPGYPVSCQVHFTEGTVPLAPEGYQFLLTTDALYPQSISSGEGRIRLVYALPGGYSIKGLYRDVYSPGTASIDTNWATGFAHNDATEGEGGIGENYAFTLTTPTVVHIFLGQEGKDQIPAPQLATPEQTPNAAFTATGADAGTLSSVTDGMKYKVGSGNWEDISSNDDIDLTGLAACTISVVKKGNGTTTADSEAQTIIVTKAAAPNLTATQPSTIGGKGSIPMTAVHEYKLSSDTAWTPAAGITELAAGTYLVRVKATGTALASESQSITLTAYSAPAVPSTPAVPTAPTTTVPVSSGEGSVSVSATVSGGTANVTVTDSQLDKVVSAAETTGTVTVDISGLKDVDSANIPAKVVSAVSTTNSSDGLEVVLPTGSVKLDAAALKSVPAGKDLTISVEEVKPSALTSAQKAVLGN